MSKPIETIGVIKETRPDENRTPLIPEHIENIKSNYPNLNVVVQPSKNRCFSDDEYKNKGAEINEDLSNCSIIFGVKEIDTDDIEPLSHVLDQYSETRSDKAEFESFIPNTTANHPRPGGAYERKIRRYS